MKSKNAAYAGPERRRRNMLVTRNTEYHFRDGVCVAVRDRHSGSFLVTHVALERKLAGTVRFLKNGVAIPSDGARPTLGDALFFEHGEREILTSPVTAVARPERELVRAYPF